MPHLRSECTSSACRRGNKGHVLSALPQPPVECGLAPHFLLGVMQEQMCTCAFRATHVPTGRIASESLVVIRNDRLLCCQYNNEIPTLIAYARMTFDRNCSRWSDSQGCVFGKSSKPMFSTALQTTHGLPRVAQGMRMLHDRQGVRWCIRQGSVCECSTSPAPITSTARTFTDVP
jgi:hypothetical protein